MGLSQQLRRVTTINHTVRPANRLPARHGCLSHTTLSNPLFLPYVLTFLSLLRPHSGLLKDTRIRVVNSLLVSCALRKETASSSPMLVITCTITWCHVSASFVQLHYVMCLLLPLGYMMSRVWFFRPVIWCHVFDSFVQLLNAICLLLSSSYMMIRLLLSSSYIMSRVSLFRRVTWCHVFDSFVPLHDITCFLLSPNYLLTYVCFSGPVTWCHVFTSFVQLHDVTCLLRSSSSMILLVCFFRVCSFRSVTWCHVFAPFVQLHYITCLLLSFSCMISRVCLFRSVTWNYMFPSLAAVCFAHSWRHKCSVKVVIKHGLEDWGIVIWLPAGATVFPSPWSLNLLWCPKSLPANRKCGLITWAKTAGTWTLAFTSN
jgi:hypothetical protein